MTGSVYLEFISRIATSTPGSPSATTSLDVFNYLYVNRGHRCTLYWEDTPPSFFYIGLADLENFRVAYLELVRDSAGPSRVR